MAGQLTTKPKEAAQIKKLNSQVEKLKKQLETSQNKHKLFKTYVDSIKFDTFFYSHDVKGVFQYLSPSIKSVLGYTQSEFMSHFTSYLTDNPMNKKVVRYTNLSIKGIQQRPYLVELHHKNGSIRTLDVVETPIKDNKGKVVIVNGIAKDITKTLEAERELKQSESKNRAFVNANPDMAFLMNTSGQIIEFFPAKEIDLKPIVKSDMFLGKSLKDILPGPLATKTIQLIKMAIKTDRIQVHEYSLMEHDEKKEYEARIAKLNKDEALLFVRDITETKTLQKLILEITEKVQIEIGQDLHDGVAQLLTGISFLVKSLENDLSSKTKGIQVKIKNILNHISDAISETKRMARGLHIVELETNGLASAMDELVNTTSITFNIDCSFLIKGENKPLEAYVEKHLYRITQESITNSIKHGCVKKIQVTLSYLNNAIKLKIKDDGKQKNKDFYKSKNGMGLSIMRYRASMIGADLSFLINKTGGVSVVCEMPL